MVSYPIVIRFFGDDRRRARVLFPDFAGCKVELPAGTDTSYDALVSTAREAAGRYLGSTDGQPGWIEKRLKSGRRVDPPCTSNLPTHESDQLSLMTDVELPPDVELALEFHWMRLALELNYADMAAVFEDTTERYRQVETCEVAPNHREKARLRNLQARSQRISSKRLRPDVQDGSSDQADDGTDAADDGTGEASNF